MNIRPVTPAIGAQVTDVHLGEAARNPDTFAQIRTALRERPDAGYLLGQLRRTYDKRLELTRMAALSAPTGTT